MLSVKAHRSDMTEDLQQACNNIIYIHCNDANDVNTELHRIISSIYTNDVNDVNTELHRIQ